MNHCQDVRAQIGIAGDCKGFVIWCIACTDVPPFARWWCEQCPEGRQRAGMQHSKSVPTLLHLTGFLQDVASWEADSENNFYVAQVYHDVFKVHSCHTAAMQTHLCMMRAQGREVFTWLTAAHAQADHVMMGDSFSARSALNLSTAFCASMWLARSACTCGTLCKAPSDIPMQLLACLTAPLFGYKNAFNQALGSIALRRDVSNTLWCVQPQSSLSSSTAVGSRRQGLGARQEVLFCL